VENNKHLEQCCLYKYGKHYNTRAVHIFVILIILGGGGYRWRT